MSIIGNAERETQNRVIDLFRDELGFRYPGDWKERNGNSNIEEGLLRAYLLKSGYTTVQITKAVHELRMEADNPNRTLYENNRSVYHLRHYGVSVKAAAGCAVAGRS